MFTKRKTFKFQTSKTGILQAKYILFATLPDSSVAYIQYFQIQLLLHNGLSLFLIQARGEKEIVKGALCSFGEDILIRSPL